MDIKTTSIKEQLATLAELQQADTAIAAIDKELSGVQYRVDLLESDLSSIKTQMEEKKKNLEELKKEYRSEEMEVKRIEAGISRSEEKLRSVKTNKEYQSMLKEMDDSRRKISDIQDKMLTLLDQIETGEKEAAGLSSDVAVVQAEVAEKKAEIERHSEALRQKRSDFQNERESIWGDLPPKLQTMYARAIQQGRGIGVTAVIDAVCQSCRINIPPQQYIELIRLNSMKLCPNCQRIIFPDTIWQGK